MIQRGPLGAGRVFALAAALVLAACTTTPPAPHTPVGGPPLLPLSGAAPGRIDVRDLPGRPRLTVVVRDGDPAPALGLVVVTELGPGPTTALAAVVESRLRTAGLDPDMRV